MSYAAAVDHLYALGHELHPAEPSAPRRKFELAHMRVLAQALGDPQKAFPSVLIAGTNGKGSTAATLASILTAAGLRTALYTSPHLIRVNERIQIDGQPISDDDFARLYFQIDDTAQRLVKEGALPHHPSFFETLTALGFLYLSEQEIDIAVLEVGMGGRLDATNIVEPVLSIITDISLDHQEYLGHTIAEIAREKAGILRAGGTLITLPQHPEANQAIGEAAATLDLRAINAARFIPAVTHVDLEETRDPEQSGEAAKSKDLRFSLFTPNRYTLTLDNEPLDVDSPLTGHHQQRNLALAIAAAVELRAKGYTITNQAIENGIRRTQWPGRLELLPTTPRILLDVAHNPAGAWTLRAAIAHLPEDQPRTLIFSCLRDKSLTEMAQILFPLFDRSNYRPYDNIILCPVNNPRATALEALAEAAHALDIPAHAAPDIAAALDQARALTPPNGLIIATGSVYLIGDIRSLALAKT
ncbi:folylpolyglutamate synthase/dihydrofolate synthase family protein [Edaphobacter sp.]|uniref:bifunctional folylpolyglutamate synthase/dihydrofolate synthase n=1 Tax=Edaphobacter sp. TaxID=1934404 RepID=UPI002DB5662C|nr:folylpolyglutamate synthase/dihydrofolate synthase family protein [Edaphobacter sp.]HEU5340425.1 folylpolyglutamate synthase/dihydrofolate synthase family protein [Edaphobacter sp.]